MKPLNRKAELIICILAVLSVIEMKYIISGAKTDLFWINNSYNAGVEYIFSTPTSIYTPTVTPTASSTPTATATPTNTLTPFPTNAAPLRSVSTLEINKQDFETPKKKP